MLLPALFATPLLLLIAFVLFRTLTFFYNHDRPLPGTRRPGPRTRLLVVLGSGGHTAEMIQMLRDLDPARYTHRSYVVSSGDAFSARKAEEFEAALASRAGIKRSRAKLYGEIDAVGSFDVCVIPRARRVHQSLASTPVTALQCLWRCFSLLRYPTTRPPSVLVIDGRAFPQVPYTYPDLILTNGPGTAVIVVLAALLVRFVGLPGASGRMRTVYVESWARVGRLSLSGRLLLRAVDRFVVQWERLAASTGGRAEYIGGLV